jgi:hypothetical protein
MGVGASKGRPLTAPDLLAPGLRTLASVPARAGGLLVGIDIGAGLSGARSLDITRAYVRAFFDQHLRSRPQALLDQQSPRYPEVTFCSR